MRLFIEYSEANVNALMQAHEDIVQVENGSDESFIAFSEAKTVSLSGEFLLVLELASLLDAVESSQNNSRYEETKKALLQNDFLSAFKVLIKYADILLQQHENTDSQGDDFTSLLILVQMVKGEAEAELVGQLVQVLASDTTTMTAYKTQLLCLLYNHLDTHSKSRYHVYQKLVEFCGKTCTIGALAKQMDSLDVWCNEWDITMKQKRDLYLTIIESAQGDCQLQLRFIKKYFASLDGGCASANEIKDNKQGIMKCIGDAIRLSWYNGMDDLLLYDAIKSMQGSPEYELLNIFVNQDIKAYESFSAQNKSTIESLKLCHENNAHKMRLLTLISIVCSKNDIQYQTVADALVIDIAHVENWIIEAIGKNLLEAKLDQINSKILIRRSIYRGFTRDNWSDLHQRLSTWTDNVGNIIQALDSTDLPVSIGGAD